MEELLPHDVVERIMERLDAKTLIKFKTVSKRWKSTIQSPFFQKRHLIHCRQSGDPHVFFVPLHNPFTSEAEDNEETIRTVVVGSSVSVQIPTIWEDKKYKKYKVCNTSCDGLVCLYNVYKALPNIVFNPTTRMHRFFPLCDYQLVRRKKHARDKFFQVRYFAPGFGKDKNSDTYKPVWLYNSAELGLNDNATTCEIFDFATNTWRYIVPASPHRILSLQDPVYVNGSVHWFTAPSDEGETMVLSLDLHTETFQIISKAPFLNAFDVVINMYNLDGRLCVSKTERTNYVIWSFDSDHRTWNKLCSMDLNTITSRYMYQLTPLAVLVNDKLLLYDRYQGYALVTHNLKTKSYSQTIKSKVYRYCVCYYFPSLISIL